jgi:hypothetical protein
MNLTVDNKMKSFLQLARQHLVETIEAEIEKTVDNEELRSVYISKLTDVLEGELKIIRSHPTDNFVRKNVPNAPVKVRGTNLYLKNIPNNEVYQKVCTAIARRLGFNDDFSDAPFIDLPKNNRVYEALRMLHYNQGLSQCSLDGIIKECETETN